MNIVYPKISWLGYRAHSREHSLYARLHDRAHSSRDRATTVVSAEAPYSVSGCNFGARPHLDPHFNFGPEYAVHTHCFPHREYGQGPNLRCVKTFEPLPHSVPNLDSAIVFGHRPHFFTHLGFGHLPHWDFVIVFVDSPYLAPYLDYGLKCGYTTNIFTHSQFGSNAEQMRGLPPPPSISCDSVQSLL
jgi:hypothetical protein